MKGNIQLDPEAVRLTLDTQAENLRLLRTLLSSVEGELHAALKEQLKRIEANEDRIRNLLFELCSEVYHTEHRMTMGPIW